MCKSRLPAPALLLLLLCTGWGLAVAAPDVSGCAKCHGDNGVSKKPEIPTIAGMSGPYLEAQMAAYQKAQRPCPKLSDPKLSDTDMCQEAKKLSVAQVKDIAAHYAGLKFVAAAQQVDAQLAAKGKALNSAHCDTCHSAGGSDPGDDAGILAGQWQPYLEATLKDYVSGKRTQPPNMKRWTSGLSGDDIRGLAAFYAGEGSKK